jgi:hypothetical protein
MILKLPPFYRATRSWIVPKKIFSSKVLTGCLSSNILNNNATYKILQNNCRAKVKVLAAKEAS